MINFHKILIFFSFFISHLFFSQQNKSKDILIADFTYLLKAKIYKSNPNYIHEEFFSLQVLNDRAFFISEKALKFDSIFQNEFQKATINGSTNTNFSGKSFPKTKFQYTIIQNSQDNQYFEMTGMTLLSYREHIINNWKLINESKIINTFNCKKAEVNYNGRNWTAWYSVDTPMIYGPYKFSGLPGLIIKISDQNGDYDFELVKSVSVDKLKGEVFRVNTLRYENAKETTREKLKQSKQNSINNISSTLSMMETTIAPEFRENLRNIQKRKQADMIDENPLEID